MNILILNASPRKNGNISRMLEVIEQEASSCGADVNVVEVSKLTIRPCVACMTCRSTKKCVLPDDDAQRVLQKIEACDAIVIGAPCYWGNIPGTLKLLFDRIVYGMMGENSMAVPVALHNNIIMNQTRGVVRALKEILGWSGFKIVATVQKGGTFRHPEFTDADRNKCRKAARKLKIK